ncbi:hypothetical protein [Alkalihalobacterium bogoriense]|uniref:hypothetical protein n=1 Tax=Alkalihalobacterium bogoriense TaxID=246272 RepID=UPI00047E683D|nr:hypothetical protein [Alkalihalobacterium bogoriense]
MVQNKKWGFIALILLVFILLAACQSADEVDTADKNDEKAIEQQNVPSEENEQEQELVDSTIEEPETSGTTENLGDYEVDWEIRVEELEDKYLIHGESNLLPETKVRVYLQSPDHIIQGYSEDIMVEEDGSFSGELEHLQQYDTEMNIGFDVRPSLQKEEILQHYGRQFEKMTGPFMAVRDNFGRELVYYVTTTLTHYPEENQLAELVSERPEWDFPSDQGDLEVRFDNVEVEKGESRLFISGESNLLDGSILVVDVSLPGYRTVGYSAKKKVNPDGSFNLSVSYPTDIDDDAEMNVIIQFTPFRDNNLPYIIEHYGVKGENLKGEFVEDHSFDNKHIKFKVNVQ